MANDPIACMMFPKIYSMISEIFSFKDCTYGIDEYKACSARG